MPLPGDRSGAATADAPKVRRAPLLTLGAAFAALAATPQAFACGSPGYSYAGLASAARAHGVGARVTAVGVPTVRSGHIAGWVGVGGPKQGPRGTDEWIQVGFSGFQGSSLASLYFEVTRSGGSPRYVEIERGIRAGASRRIAVLEMAKRPNWWRVWVNGHAVSEPIQLPGSHGAWRGVATAESWGAGSSACNQFAFRFDRIVVARHPGGGWRTLSSALPIRRGGYRMTRPSSSSFVAVSGKLVKPQPLRPVASASTASKQPAAAPANPGPPAAPAPQAPQPAAPVEAAPLPAQPTLRDPVDP